MTEDQINSFEKCQTQLDSLHKEISALAKKSANDSLNKFKLKYVNKNLEDANKLLGSKYKPFEDFDQFEDSALPTNSDVTMILGQYLNCMEKLRSDNIKMKSGWWYWVSDEGDTTIVTAEPKKIENK